MERLCKSLNQIFLMPKHSPYLSISEDETYYYFEFNGQKIPFLKEDVKILPVTNITVEELARYLVVELLKDKQSIAEHAIEKIKVKVFSAPGQSASYEWTKSI